MNSFSFFIFRILRKLFRDRGMKALMWRTSDYCDSLDQEGNDRIYKLLSHNHSGLMLSKWGTFEYSHVLACYFSKIKFSAYDWYLVMRGRIPIPSQKASNGLYYNAGVFPFDDNVHARFAELALSDCQQIDILGSYIRNEKYLASYWQKALKVNLDAFYAPWMFKNPWTKWLAGKKVLVVHPFVDSISHQYYNNRVRLFDNPDVLPEFGQLICIKAVQTQAGEESLFKDWLEALAYMESEIDKCNYDVALIGCGAYGMSLAAHVKRCGKVGIHLGGWVQMLFGVYGKRWLEDQPQYAKYINQYWIRPSSQEQLANGRKIEGGCYW